MTIRSKLSSFCVNTACFNTEALHAAARYQEQFLLNLATGIEANRTPELVQAKYQETVARFRKVEVQEQLC